MRGFTLVEALICVSIIILLVSILGPTLDAVWEQVRLTRCASQMHAVGQALLLYASQSDFSLPPFAFSDRSLDLPLSGHWGGSGKDNNPDLLSQKGVAQANLQVLVGLRLAPASQLVCPGAGEGLRDRKGSWFATSKQFSTFCMRFPLSKDLFAESPHLWSYNSLGPIGIYAARPGGFLQTTSLYSERVPLVRLDLSYDLMGPVRFGSRDFDPARDAVLADAFWFQASGTDHRGRSVERAWCHGRRFNCLRGDGSVRRREDDGTVADHVQRPDQKLPWDGLYYATYSEQVWQFLGRRE